MRTAVRMTGTDETLAWGRIVDRGIVKRLPRPARVLVRKALTLFKNPRGVYHKYKYKLVRLFGGVAPIYGVDYQRVQSTTPTTFLFFRYITADHGDSVDLSLNI